MENRSMSDRVLDTFEVNPFELFDLMPSYALDMRALDQAYFKLQSTHHPDRAAHDHHLQSSTINRAYQSLKNPITRAKVLLEILGIHEHDLDDADSTTDASARLSDLLEFQESIAMCSDIEMARALMDELDERIIRAQHDFSEHFDQGEYIKLPEIYGQMGYFDRLKRQITDVEENLFKRSPHVRYM